MRPRRLLPAVALLAATATPTACGDSDGHVVHDAQPTAPDTTRGPLGNRIGVDEQVHVLGLDGPVDIVRDAFGIIHIYAQTPRDAFRVQGWAMARDRAPQLELLRRLARGRLAAAFGDADPSFIDQDIAMRVLGAGRAAAASYGALDPQGEPRQLLDAFSDGISQYFESIRTGSAPLPSALAGLSRNDFTPWSGVDSLAIAVLNAAAVSLPTVHELAVERLVIGVAQAFPADSPDPALSHRAHVLPDLLRFAPPDPSTVIPPSELFPYRAAAPAPGAHDPLANAAPLPWSALGNVVSALGTVLDRVGPFGQVGSNAWAVAPARSSTGHAVLASDPHFQLSSPAALWLVHIDVSAGNGSADPRDIHAAGAAMAGLPGIAYGFNRSLAWGAAASYIDTADLYRDAVNADASGVRYLGDDVPFVRTSETVAIRGSAPLVFDVLQVPHHGPVLPRIKDHAVVPPDPSSEVVSLRWTGAEASTDLAGSIALLRAGGVDDARAAARLFETGGLAYVFADDAGHILFSAHARVPIRDPRALDWDAPSSAGSLPCRALPGNGSSEWTGVLDDAALPLSEDPSEGFVATANSDPVGGTLDNDPSNDHLPGGAPLYLGCSFDVGFRLGRIRSLLLEPGKLHSLDSFSAIQADVRSPLGARIAPFLVAALGRALKEQAVPGTFPHLSAIVSSARFSDASVDQVVQLLEDWGTMSAYRASPGVKLADAQPSSDMVDATGSRAATLFNAWLVRLVQRTFSDESSRIGVGSNLPEPLIVRALIHLLESEPTLLASYDSTLRDSILWDDLSTPALETRDEVMVSSLLDAIAWLEVQLGSNRDEWRWGRLHTVRLQSPFGALAGFSVPHPGDKVFVDGFPRPGDLFAIDAAPFDLTPASLDADGFHVQVGPTLRLVVDMSPTGPVAQVVLAGGQIADPASSHFADETEYWRHDRSHALAFELDAVLAAAESRAVVSSTSH